MPDPDARPPLDLEPVAFERKGFGGLSLAEDGEPPLTDPDRGNVTPEIPELWMEELSNVIVRMAVMLPLMTVVIADAVSDGSWVLLKVRVELVKVGPEIVAIDVELGGGELGGGEL